MAMASRSRISSKTTMKKLLKHTILPILLGLAIAGSAHAQVASPNYWKKIGNNIYPINASGTIGTSSISAIVNNLTVNGSCTGCGLSSSSAVTSFNGATGTVSGVGTFNGATGTVTGVGSLTGTANQV